MKRIFALLCAILMLVSAIACGKVEPNDTTASTTTAAPGEATTTAAAEPAETEPPKAFDSVPEQNYGGHMFNIMYAQADECYKDFYAEQMNGDVQNDAVYERNSMVKEKLNIDMTITWDTYQTVNDKARMQSQAGSQDYDLFGGHRDSLKLTYQGFLYDLNQIEALDLEQIWWDQGWIEAITVGDALYTIIGDVNVSAQLFVSSLAFNKRLMDENNIAYPYDLVRQGKWTMDVYNEMITDFGADLNGDGVLKPEDDLFSLIGWSYESGYSNLYGADFIFTHRAEDGSLSVSFDMEKVLDLSTRIVDLYTKDYVYLNTGAGVAEHVKCYGTFAAGRALFADTVLTNYGIHFTTMEDDFGIVPVPKYDESQENYKSYLGYTIPMMFITNNTSDPERTGTILEAFCTSSYDHVYPKMYEVVTKLKNARDEDSSEMIDIIIRNKIIDPLHFYNITGYGNFGRNLVVEKNANVSSKLKSYEKVAAKEWDKIMAAFEGIKK